MCGIVGYVGHENARDIVIDGLKKLEYRGYDSAGIALLDKGKLIVRKQQGKIANLEAAIAGENLQGTTGIGHTRWATHGAPSNVNAHPHTDMNSSIAIVHNGIVENYMELKEWMKEEHGRHLSDGDGFRGHRPASQRSEQGLSGGRRAGSCEADEGRLRLCRRVQR